MRSVELLLLLHGEDPHSIAGLCNALPAAWPHDFEGKVTIIDNASRNNVAEVALEAIQSSLPDVSVGLIRMPRNVGFARAINHALHKSTATFLVVINPDGQPEADAIPRLISALNEEPRAIMAAAQVLDLGADDTPPDGPPVAQEWCPGPAAVYRRELFAALGGFDELFFLYAEDVDLGKRASAAGLVSLLVPAAVYRHEPRDLTLWREFQRRRFHAKHQLAVKHIYEGLPATARSFAQLHWWAFRMSLLRRRRPVAAVATVIGAWEYFGIARACQSRRQRGFKATQPMLSE